MVGGHQEEDALLPWKDAREVMLHDEQEGLDLGLGLRRGRTVLVAQTVDLVKVQIDIDRLGLFFEQDLPG